MGVFGGIAQGLGNFGSQVGEAYDIGQTWQERAQNMKMQAARQKIADLMGPLQLQEIQKRLTEMGQPKAEGIVSTPGGGSAGVTFQGGRYSTQPIAAGADPKAIQKQISSMAATAPKEYQSAMQAIAGSIDAGEDPLKALDKANTLMGQAAGKEQAQEGKTKFKIDMKDGTIIDKDGKPWSIYDPALPPDLKNLVDSANKREREESDRKTSVEAKKFAEQTARMFQMNDLREQMKGYDNTLKIAQRGIAGHSFLKTVEDQVGKAGQNGGQGTTAGDMLLIEGYMQLMFGVDPKALRGSPQMQQNLLKQGGVDDRVIAWFNNVQTGGKLDQNVRQQILDSSRDQVNTFDQAVEQTGQLVDNPKVQDLVGRYKRATGAGQNGGSPQTQKKDDDIGFVPDASTKPN